MSKEKEHYKIVVGDTPDELEEIVDIHIKNGWMCQGGIACMQWARTNRHGMEERCMSFYQALVKRLAIKVEIPE